MYSNENGNFQTFLSKKALKSLPCCSNMQRKWLSGQNNILRALPLRPSCWEGIYQILTRKKGMTSHIHPPPPLLLSLSFFSTPAEDIAVSHPHPRSLSLSVCLALSHEVGSSPQTKPAAGTTRGFTREHPHTQKLTSCNGVNLPSYTQEARTEHTHSNFQNIMAFLLNEVTNKRIAQRSTAPVLNRKFSDFPTVTLPRVIFDIFA